MCAVASWLRERTGEQQVCRTLKSTVTRFWFSLPPACDDGSRVTRKVRTCFEKVEEK